MEQHLGRDPPPPCPPEAAHRILCADVRPAHFAAIKRLVDFDLTARSKLRVAHDALFGVGAGVFENLLPRTQCTVTTLNDRHDMLLGACVRNRGGRGTVTKTFNTTALVDKPCTAWNLPLTEVAIGFRFVAPELMKPGALFGAEESGSVGFVKHLPERDGLAAGLMLLEMLAMERSTVNQIYARLEREFGPHHYGRFDAHHPPARQADLMASLQADPPPKLLCSPLARVETRDGVKFVAKITSWLMLRASGTEPVWRIYAEARSAAEVRTLLKLGISRLRS